MELIIDVLLITSFQVLYKLLEHLTQNLELYFVDSSQHLNGNGLVDGEHLGNGGGIVARQVSSSSLEVSLLEVGLGELHEVGVEVLASLLISQLEALVPPSLLH